MVGVGGARAVWLDRGEGSVREGKGTRGHCVLWEGVM